MHVLLIEDDPLVALGIRSGLMTFDFVVDRVSTLKAARQALQTVSSDVVILETAAYPMEMVCNYYQSGVNKGSMCQY